MDNFALWFQWCIRLQRAREAVNANIGTGEPLGLRSGRETCPAALCAT